jgi:hypothetical protein
VPEATAAAGTRVVNFMGGQTLPWRFDGAA